MSPTIAITGGHSTGIALVEEILKTRPDWQIIYLGRKYSLEGKATLSFEWNQLSKRKDLRFIPIISGRLQRKFSSSTIPSILKIPIGFFQSFFILLTNRPTVTVSFGGYLSLPVVIASWILRVPVISHEQTSAIGLANKINMYFSKKIALSFPATVKDVDEKKAVYTGNLILDLVKNKKDPSGLEKINQKSKESKKPILYITGGKTGSAFINSLVKKSLEKLTKEYIVVHQTGDLQYPSFKKIKTNNYYPLKNVPFSQQGWLLNNAKLVVSRGGANIVFELATVKKPAVMIPIPWSSGNEQGKNCQFLENIGLATCLDQNKIGPKEFLEAISQIANKIDKRELSIKKRKIKNGRKKMVLEIEKLIDESSKKK